MLEYVGADLDRPDAEPSFIEEDGKADAGADHRGDEQEGNRSPEAVAGQKGEEQEDDDGGDEKGRQDRGENCAAHGPAAAVEQPNLGNEPVMLFAAAFKDAWLKLADAIDDPRQPPGADIEEGAKPGEQEYRRHCQLDDLREMGEIKAGGGKKRIAVHRSAAMPDVGGDGEGCGER